MLFNAQYKGLNMNEVKNQSLGCVDVHECIFYCTPNGECKLRMFDAEGNAHIYPYTTGGLLDMANNYLGKNLNLSGGQTTLYATALNAALEKVNAYWNNGQTSGSCNPAAGAVQEVVEERAMQQVSALKGQLAVSLTPNPASNSVNFQLEEMETAQKVTLSVYNQLGQLILMKDYGTVTQLNERVDLTGIGKGLYVVRMDVGEQHIEQKLVVQK
jgi:hypothetical protein